jgi:hypothetical protein
MPVKLRCTATADLLLLSALAQDLLARLGKDAAQAGILEPQDMPAALRVLHDLDDARPESAAKTSSADEPAPEPDFVDEAVSLRKRAWPLIQMIERALAAQKPIVWGV